MLYLVCSIRNCILSKHIIVRLCIQVKQKGENIINEFGKQVKKALIDKDMTQKQLIDEVSARTGMYFDRAYIWKVCQGKRNPKIIVEAIKEILGLEEESET